MAGMFRRAMVYLGLVDDEYDDYEPYEEAQPAGTQGSVRSYPAPEAQPDVAAQPVAPQGSIRTLPREPLAREPLPREPVAREQLPREPLTREPLTREPQPEQPAPVSVAPRSAGVVRPIAPSQGAKVHVVAPTRFPEAQEIGDLLRASQPVIVNLQGADRELSRRMIDFCSGVTYALAGSMEKVADQVFLLTPSNVEVSAEEKRRLQERGLYDN